MELHASIMESKTLQLSLAAAELRKAGREIISLGLGEPEIGTPKHIVEAAKAALDQGLTRYSAAAGLPDLRERVAEKLKRENAIAARAEQVVITPGAKNALFIACASVLRPGDEVVVLTPCYVSNIPIVRLAEPGAIVREVPAGPDFEIDFDRLASAINERTRLLIINFPNNPTGRMLRKDEAEKLVSLVARHRQLHLLSDEIYDRVVFGNVEHLSPGAHPDIADRVFTVNGFGKAFAMTGWRVGYLHAPKPMIPAITALTMQINTNVAVFVQKAALAALEGPEDHLVAYNALLSERKRIYDAFVAEHPLLRGSSPEGGYFAFLDISAASLGSDDFAAALIRETGVAVTPGNAFGTGYDGYCRISLVNRTDVVEDGLRRIGAFVDRIADPVRREECKQCG